MLNKIHTIKVNSPHIQFGSLCVCVISCDASMVAMGGSCAALQSQVMLAWCCGCAIGNNNNELGSDEMFEK